MAVDGSPRHGMGYLGAAGRRHRLHAPQGRIVRQGMPAVGGDHSIREVGGFEVKDLEGDPEGVAFSRKLLCCELVIVAT